MFPIGFEGWFFAGLVVNEQVLEFEFDVGVLGNLAALRRTKALRLTVGSF